MKETITVIQLGGLSDQLQTLPVLRGLKKKTGALIRLITAVEPLDILRAEKAADEWLTFDEVMKQKQSTKPQGGVILNLTFNETAGALVAKLGAIDVRGFYCANGQLEIVDPWSRFYTSAALRTHINRFHRVDHFKAMAGLINDDSNGKFHVTAAQKALGQKLLLECRIPTKDRRIVVIDVDAASAEEMWPLVSTVEVADRLHEIYPDLTFLFVGRKSERDKVAGMIASRAYCTNLVGLTDSQNLCGLLSMSQLVLSSGSESACLAAGLGVPTVSIAHGPNRFWESGPYEEGQWVIRAVSGAAQATVVACVVASVLEKETEDLNAILSQDQVHRVYVSTKATYQQTKYKQVAGHKEQSVEGWFVDTYNTMRFEEMSGLPMLPSKIQPIHDKRAAVILDILASTLEKTYEVAEFGLRYGDLIKKEWKTDAPNVQEIKTLGQRLKDVDETLHELSKKVPYLQALIDEFEVEQMSLSAGDSFTIVSMGLESYERLMKRCSYLFKKTRILLERVQSSILGSEGSPPPDSKPSPSAMDCMRFNIHEINL